MFTNPLALKFEFFAIFSFILGFIFLIISSFAGYYISSYDNQDEALNKYSKTVLFSEELQNEYNLITKTNSENSSSIKEKSSLYFTEKIKKGLNASAGCKIAGCNGQLCINENIEAGFTTCNYNEIYSCLDEPGVICTMNKGNCEWQYSEEYNQCVDSLTEPEKLRVIEIRYFPLGEAASVYHPDDLSSDLQNMLNDASKHKGYNDLNAISQIEVEIVDVINVYAQRTNPDNTWQSAYEAMIDEHNLCTRISNENIDQIWMWVDTRPGVETAPGVEYAISSKYFQTGQQYVTTPYEPFCEGDRTFVIMGFDTTRTADLALHSFGHYFEGLLGNIQEVELFWYRFGGNTLEGFPRSLRCGNVHFPPNGQVDYDYDNLTNVNSSCEDWNPDSTGQIQTFNCTKWGCNQEGYLKWWMQNFPILDQNLIYNEKIIPSWWTFTVNFDEKVTYFYNDNSIFLNRAFIDLNLAEEVCECIGTDQYGDPVYTNQCDFSVVGLDLLCYQCRPYGWQLVDNSVCQ